MSLREEQCKKVCRILDNVLANRPAERDSLIVATRKAFKALAEPHWIPVKERLPEENDYKSCIECLDGAVWYFSENGTMGIGYYYESTKEWSTTDDLKTDGKVVAWMPLPEPYRGEDK